MQTVEEKSLLVKSTDRIKIRLGKTGDRFSVDVFGVVEFKILRMIDDVASLLGCLNQSELIAYQLELENLERLIESNFYEAVNKGAESLYNDENFPSRNKYLLSEIKRWTNADPRVGPASTYARQFISLVPERIQLTHGMYAWDLAATDITASLIKLYWPVEQQIIDEDAKTTIDYLLMRSDQQNLNALNSARYAVDKTVPHHSYILHDKFELSGYQQLALVNCFHSEGYALFMDPGTGKTPVCIAKLCNAATQKKGVYTNIVVCPNNVRMNWRNEIEKFRTCKGKVTILRGDELKRRKLLIDAFKLNDGEEFTTVVVSYETLQRSWEILSLIPWDLAVGDESHYFKNPRTKRFKFMMKLRDISDARMPLTGTPITNNCLDLYAHFEFMGKGMSGFMSDKNFRSFYAVIGKDQSGREKLESIKNIPFMKERLAKNAFQISLQEALPDLPDRIYDVVEVEMSPEQQEVYDEMKHTLALEIEQDLASDRPKSMIAMCILTKLLRLTQITSGFVVWDPVYNDEGEVLHSRETEFIKGDVSKIVALLELLKDKSKYDKTIIWATFIPDIKAISSALKITGYDCVEYYGGTSDKDREIAEIRFNTDPSCRFLVGNPAAGGTGLNLQGWDINQVVPDCEDAQKTNTTHIIYYSQDWSMVKRTQSEYRGYRRGTRVPVRVTDLCVPCTIDEEIRARVLQKSHSAMEIADVRSILAAVLGGKL